MARTLQPGSEGHSSPKGRGTIGSGLGSESWWHSPNSSSSQAGAASRPSQALWAQGRTQTPPLQGAHTLQLSLIPPYLPSLSCKLPWVKPPETVLFLGRQPGVTPFFSLPTPVISICSPQQPSAPQAPGRHCPHQCSSPSHSWMCQCPFALLATCRAPCPLPFLILVPPRTSHLPCLRNTGGPSWRTKVYSALYWPLGARPEDLGPSRYCEVLRTGSPRPHQGWLKLGQQCRGQAGELTLAHLPMYSGAPKFPLGLNSPRPQPPDTLQLPD